MALATANELGAGILVLSEPNRNAIKNRKDWVCDEDIDTAIKVMDSNLVIKAQGRGRGFSYVTTSYYTIYSCYFSGNDEFLEFEQSLEEIAVRIRTYNEKAIVAGDFNAKSPQWGMTFTDRRGQLVTEWLAANDLIIVNQGDKPTFLRRDYSSILDLTVVTADIKTNIVSWEVSDRETLSDHNYIVFDIRDHQVRNPKPQHIGWNTRKIDKGKLLGALNQIEQTESTTSLKGFSEVLINICNKAMPKRKVLPGKKPVYWWSEEIAQLRAECIQKRRMFSRRVRTHHPEIQEQLFQQYKDSKKNLRNAIKASKRASWKALCDKVDCDIFGDGYKIVMKKLAGFPPRPKRSMDFLEEVAGHLFPTHQQLLFNRDVNSPFNDFSVEEVRTAAGKLKNNKAPGPNNIPSDIIKQVALLKPDYIMSVYNRLAAGANFPKEWKQAKLVLLNKGDQLENDPGSYRPISLLDAEGKLYEHLLLARLNQELQIKGGLSNRQFGFREGRQTVDALKEVIRIAREAAAYTPAYRRLCAVITLDVKNAFNSASRQLIVDELQRRDIDRHLISTIISYLSERQIILEAANATKSLSINSGVPQGSVLGPTLWNILYDNLLEMEMPEGTTLIGFADDVALVVTGINENVLMNNANTGLQRVANWMARNQLELAAQKTEAVLLTTKRKILPTHFVLQGTVVFPTNKLKYLGVWLDTKLVFAEHVNKATEKAERTISALGSIMPNIGGPRASKRRILASVIHSQLLYGAPVWHSVTGNKKLVLKLTRIQRLVAIRVCSAYRTTSAEAVGVISGIPPIELLIEERNAVYNGTPRIVAKANTRTRWQEKWTNGIYGRWTHNLIPDIERWLNRPFGEVDYFLTQALSGHGCFREYLFRRNRVNSNSCLYCDQVDNAEHTLFGCNRWTDIRASYERTTGSIFNATNMVNGLVESEDTWKQAYAVVRHIIENKERESRNQ